MRPSIWLTGMAIALLALGGCNKAQPPAEVQADVSSATNAAIANNTQAGANQAEVAASVTKDLDSAAQTADAKTTEAAADVSVTQAEGNYKIALAKCEALAGDSQKACKDDADAALKISKAKARATKADHS
jgi:hypothetical protein